MHIHHTAPADGADQLLTLADCDRLLTASGIRTPAIRLVRDGSVLAESSYTRGATLAGKPLTGLVDARTALTHFRAGATVVFQGLHRYHPPLADLVASLELELGHPCQANAYLTPAGAQGFAVHRDPHDVFVVQTAGTKLWRVEDDDVLMEPGLVMYLPTGTAHSARAQDDVSLHVTLGINQFTWRDVVRRGLDLALNAVPSDHLPAGYLADDADVREQLAQHLADLADEVRQLDPQAVLDAEIARFLTSRPSRHPAGLLDTLAADTITDETSLHRIPARTCVVQRRADRPDRLRVLLGDRSLDVPSWLEPALEQISASTRLQPSDLAVHLDPQSRVVLCRRLVREGLLTTRPLAE